MNVTAFSLAQRFVGVKEVPGSQSNSLILAMLQLDSAWPADDEVAWCSAFLNFIAWMLRLPRSKNLAARSWLEVGRAVALKDAIVGSDVVVIKRGLGVQPGPEVVNAPGHVGLYAGHDDRFVQLLAGNQGNSVSVAAFDVSRVLGVRRLE